MGKKILMALVIIFAVIGLICVIGFLAMGFMHGSMMAEMCNGRMGGDMEMMSRP